MTDNDWGSAITHWQPGPRQPSTFKQDLGGFVLHLAMGLLGELVAALRDAPTTLTASSGGYLEACKT